MPENIPSPLDYHYQTIAKLDYFILSVSLALLGWTIVNTDWLPEGQLYIWLITIFWLFIIVSIICGIIRQLYTGMAFGVNHQMLRAGEMADLVEKSSVQGRVFIDQQTGEAINADEFKEMAQPHRETEKKGKGFYERYNNRAARFGDAEKALLVMGLFVLVCIRIVSLTGSFQ